MAEQISLPLERWSSGDRSALDQLLAAVYEKLRRLGRNYLHNRLHQSILEPTVLIHEVWMKISEKQRLSIHNRSQFYAFSATIVRDILVDDARRRRAAKRGGNQLVTNFDDTVPQPADVQIVNLLELDDALLKLGKINPRYVQIVEMKFFGGLNCCGVCRGAETGVQVVPAISESRLYGPH